jgi:hypothetical protein
MTDKNRFGFLAHRAGVVCPKCSTKLRIMQGRSMLVLAALYTTAFVTALILGQVWPSRGAFFISMAILLTLFAFHSPIARYFSRLERREGSYTVDFPVERLKLQLSQATSRCQEQLDQRPTTEWICPRCNTENSGEFEFCSECAEIRGNGI